MIKSIIGGAAAAALLWGPASAAPAPHTSPPSRVAAPKAMAMGWVVTPTEAGCRVALDLTGRSGAIMPISLTSDGQLISLRFAKDDLPTRAFLPIRVDRARFSNLMLRAPDGSGELVLSEETEAAMRKGTILDIAWLGDEPLSTPLAGSEQGLADLRICGAQTAAQHRERLAADQAARDHAEADARAKAVNDAQLAAAQAQAAAAEAQRRQVEEVAERQRRADQAEQARLDAEAQQRAYDDERRRAYARQQDDPRQDDGEDDDPRWAPPPPQPQPQPYWPRWRYGRY